MTAPSGTTCPECHGAGEWKTQVAADNWDMGSCETCGGTGYVPDVTAPTPRYTELADSLESGPIRWSVDRLEVAAALRHAADLDREAQQWETIARLYRAEHSIYCTCEPCAATVDQTGAET